MRTARRRRCSAAALARAIDDERKGLPTITVIEEGDTSNKVRRHNSRRAWRSRRARGLALTHGPVVPSVPFRRVQEFWEKLGGVKPIPAAIPDTPQKVEKKLFRLSDSTGKLTLTEVKPVAKSSLKSEDAFILDAGDHVYVWIGLGASKEERSKGITYATEYLYKNNRPKHLPITRVLEGGNNTAFLYALEN